MKTLHPAWWCGLVVPEVMFVSIRVINDGSAGKLGLQTVCIQLCLLLSFSWTLASSFCLHNRKRLTIFTPKHIVNETDALIVWHSLNFVLSILRFGQSPARLPKEQVNKIV